MNRVMEARFRQEDSGWVVQLVPDPDGLTDTAVHRPWRRWERPDDPNQLLQSIISQQHDRELVEGPWRLRLRPERLDPPRGELPDLPLPDYSWSAMYHNGAHVLYCNWSVAEMSAPVAPQSWTPDGTVTVVGGRDLGAKLRELRVQGLHEIDVGQPIPRLRTLLVVRGRPAAKSVALLQQAAQRAQCPLVVWCDTFVPSGTNLLEIVRTGEDFVEPVERWLAVLIQAVQAGHDAEIAFMRAARGLLVRSIRGFKMHGTLRPWQAAGTPPFDPRHDGESPRWRDEIDRWHQEGRLKGIVARLVALRTAVRMHVVVVPGAAGAGLANFRQRMRDPVQFARDGAEVVSWEPAWAPLPEETLDTICQENGVEEPQTLAYDLLNRVRGGILMLHWCHPVATEAPFQQFPLLTIDALRAYLVRLRSFASVLGNNSLCVLVTLYLVTTSPGDMEQVLAREGDTFCAVTTLNPVEARVPRDELFSFLQDRSLVETREEFEILCKRDRLDELSYEELVEALARVFPGRLL